MLGPRVVSPLCALCVQLSTRTGDFIVDAIALRDLMPELNEVFTNPHVVKVGVHMHLAQRSAAHRPTDACGPWLSLALGLGH